MNYGTIGIISRNNDSENLFLYRKDRRFMNGVDSPPGGKVELGENSRECVIREVEEETGLHLMEVRYLGNVIFDNRNRIFEDGGTHSDYSVQIYASDSFEGTLRGSEEGIPRWVKKTDFHNLKLTEGDLVILDNWMPRKRLFSGLMMYDGRKLSEWKVRYQSADGTWEEDSWKA